MRRQGIVDTRGLNGRNGRRHRDRRVGLDRTIQAFFTEPHDLLCGLDPGVLHGHDLLVRERPDVAVGLQERHILEGVLRAHREHLNGTLGQGCFVVYNHVF